MDINENDNLNTPEKIIENHSDSEDVISEHEIDRVHSIMVAVSILFAICCTFMIVYSFVFADVISGIIYIVLLATSQPTIITILGLLAKTAAVAKKNRETITRLLQELAKDNEKILTLQQNNENTVKGTAEEQAIKTDIKASEITLQMIKNTTNEVAPHNKYCVILESLDENIAQPNECPCCFAEITDDDVECPNCGYKLK